MTTATKTRKRAGKTKRKPTSGPPRRKANAKPSANGKPRTAGSKDAPGQKFIAGTEPEKIPELDAMVSKYTNFKKASENAKDSANDELGKIKSKMEEVNIEYYKTPFGDVSVQHGVTIIKVKLPKSQ